MDGTKRDKIRVVLKGGSQGKFYLEGLTPEEIENMEGILHNHFYVTVNHKGRLETIRRKELVPRPAEDEEMLPFWRRQKPVAVQLELFRTESFEHYSPSIIISSLCGYNYTPEFYKKTAEQLESYGFECMRSRRGNDGKFGEIWVLSGPWAAKGELGEVVRKNQSRKSKKKKKDELKIVIRFLCNKVSFGSLDVMIQKAAMVTD